VLVALALTMALGMLGVFGFVFGIVILVAGAIYIGLVGSVLSAVYKTALYRFAQNKESGPFGGSLQSAVY
jgi:hypothetical protein